MATGDREGAGRGGEGGQRLRLHNPCVRPSARRQLRGGAGRLPGADGMIADGDMANGVANGDRAHPGGDGGDH
jgi:hypothetical protein